VEAASLPVAQPTIGSILTQSVLDSARADAHHHRPSDLFASHPLFLQNIFSFKIVSTIASFDSCVLQLDPTLFFKLCHFTSVIQID
jgi:hypothetical protein